MVKAKEFHIPFTWEERRVMIEDGVWFMPPARDADPFQFTGWDMLFAKDRPVKVEYCSGNGSWIVERAKAEPQYNWLAIEKRFDRTRLIWARAKNAKLDNFAVAFAEGVELTRRFFPSSSVSEIFVNFPDPWPKRRHAKHRIIREEFVQELTRIIPSKGCATLVTDNEEYSAIMIEEMLQNPLFVSEFGPPHYVEPDSGYGTSYFDSLFRSQDKKIRLHRFVRS